MSRPGSVHATVAALVVALVVCTADRPAAQNPARASQNSAAEKFQSLLATAQIAFVQAKWDDATAGFQAMVDFAREQHDELWEARGLLGLGRIAARRSQYAAAKSTLLQALPVFERRDASFETGMVEETLGGLAEVMGDGKPAALAHYQRAVAAYEKAGDRHGRVNSQYNLLRVDDHADPAYFGKLDTARQDAAATGDHVLEGAILHLWGDVMFGSGDYDGAIAKLEEAVGVLSTGSPSSELGTTYTSLGRIYRLHGQVSVALQYQLKALAIHEKFGPSVSRVQSLNAVAVTYASLGDTKQAKIYYERAIAMADTVAPPMTRSFLRANYGSFLGYNGELARGRDMLADAIPNDSPVQRTLRYAELADLDFRLNRLDDALADAEQAVAACGSALTQFDCIRAKQTRGQVQLALGNEAAAIADHDAALRELEETHSRLAAVDFLKQGFEDLWAPSYSLGIELHYRRGEVREALETAERARSRALLDLLASRHLGAPPQPTTASLTLRGGPPKSIRSDAAAGSATTADLTAMATRLHSTLLLYWVADDKIYEWVLAANGTVSSASVSVPRSKLTALIRATSAFADDAASRGPTARTRGDQAIPLVMKPQAAWRELYDLLILPVASHLPTAAGSRLTIVPHGPLIDVPFAALRDAQGHYLLERYAIHSLTAGAMLEYTKTRSGANPRSGSMLLVADPAQPPKIAGEPPLPRLPGANTEVREIAKLLPAARTMLLADAAATESKVLAATANRSVLHFATHAIVRDADPLSSFLALGREGAASGQLTAQKIYDLRLDANLVVLSACRSGEGVPNGDGIAALARAFFYAGTSSLIVSLWDIADEPSNRLLPAFYREWLKGTDKARALRAAQLQLIADLRAGRVKVSTPAGDIVVPEDPAFWAGFVLLGEPD
jgi:CHAT domain-containing protein/Tfp pilus assembly protein PilF